MAETQILILDFASIHQNAIVAKALPRVPLGSLQRSPNPLAVFKDSREGEKGKWKGMGKVGVQRVVGRRGR